MYCAFRLGVSDILFSVFTPYPGSELFEKLRREKKLIVDDNYFKKLIVQFDFTKGDSYCENISAPMIVILRFLGFSMCYLTIYITRPKMVYRLIKNIFQKRFLPNNILEQRLFEFYLRWKLNKRSRENKSLKKA